MGQEFRVIGPPGTGKTTWLSRQAQHAADKHGANEVMLSSLTRAAALEIAGRDTTIPRENIGTLHAFAWRAVDRPKIAESKLKEWNEANKSWQMSVGSTPSLDDADVMTFETAGDQMLAMANVLRQQMRPVEVWPPRIARFFQRWCEWKTEAELMDFTDLIEGAIANSFYAPGHPSVIMGDEAQDWSALEAALMRKWGSHAQTFVMVGDPDQSIYGWRGADPMIFQTPPVPDEQKRILKQSYRIPKAVHEKAMAWIRQVPNRENVEFLPREEEGFVTRTDATFKAPEMVIDLALEETFEGRSVMLLTTCAYMLEPIKAILRREGIPFHNPYRPTRGDWNPLRSHGITASDRLLAFISSAQPLFGGKGKLWSVADIQQWSEHVKSDLAFRRGAKSDLDKLQDGFDGSIEWNDLVGLFKDEQTAFDAALASEDAKMDWMIERLLPAKARLYDFPKAIFDKMGSEGLTEPPRITIGTIHSVKGGESDTVILFPDLSMAGMNQYIAGGEGKNEIIRQFYVGMTRSKQGLIMASPSSRMSVCW